MRLEITGVAGGGRGFAREGGLVWLVAGALPGELVDAEVECRRAGIVEARAVGVLRASPWRAADVCPVADRCGGCDLAHVVPSARPEILRQTACGALRHAVRLLGERVAGAPVVVSEGERFRLRARLHWDPAGPVLGFRAHRSHEIVRIDRCRVTSGRFAGQLGELEAVMAGSRLGPGEVEWLEDLDASSAVAGWWGSAGRIPAWGGVDGFWRVGPATGGRDDGWGARGVVMRLPIPLVVPVGSFFQGNRRLVPLLWERVAGIVRQTGFSRAVDLYGGVGFFASAAVVGGATDVMVVETDPQAVAAARSNLPAARVVAATCERFLGDAGAGDETVAIADPPRAGLSRQARRGLLEWGPALVVLLSCDAARFGRDAGAFLEAGYDLDELELWDMFPGTHHVEILSVFRRGGA